MAVVISVGLPAKGGWPKAKIEEDKIAGAPLWFREMTAFFLSYPTDRDGLFVETKSKVAQTEK